MSTYSSPSPPTDPVEVDLVAYLDGELDAAELQRVEDRLSHDPVYRTRLRQLQGIWDLLDELPRSSVNESFTRSTVEMVAVQAEESLQTAQRRERRRQSRPLLLSGIAIAGALACGYLAGSFVWSSPDEELIQDLPVIENLDSYLVADDVEFLKSLQRAGLFAEESSDVP
jgi:anti-sigma factor RsiW